MLDISWGGLLGSIVGTILSALIYGTLIDAIERLLKARQKSDQQPDQPPGSVPMSGAEIALMRRGVLAVNILAFASLGYVSGHWIESYFA